MQTPKAPITGLFADPRLNHQAIGPLTYPPAPPPPPQKEKPDLGLLLLLISSDSRVSSHRLRSRSVFFGGSRATSTRAEHGAGVGEEISPRTMAFFSKLLVSRGISLEKCSEKYIMYINSKKKKNTKQTREIQLPPSVITECCWSVSQHIADFLFCFFSSTH